MGDTVVAEPVPPAVGERHGPNHQRGQRCRRRRDSPLGRDERLGRLVRREMDAGEGGQQAGLVGNDRQARRDLPGRLVVSAEVGEQQSTLPVRLRRRLGIQGRGHASSVGATA